MKTNHSRIPVTLNLPNLHQATLDRHGLDQLFAEIGEHAAVSDVIPKFTHRDCQLEGPVTLVEARKLLLHQNARGVQICYRYDGSEWRDTIMTAPEGFRLVRIKNEVTTPEKPRQRFLPIRSFDHSFHRKCCRRGSA